MGAEIEVAFVQVTRAHSHSFKSRYMNRMEKQLNLLHGKPLAVQFYFVVPTTQLASFNLPSYVDAAWATRIHVVGFDRTT